MAGRIVVLNGTSSSGKTTLARALQAIWDGPLLLVGLDHVISMLPFTYTGDGPHAVEGYLVTREDDADGPFTRYAIGPVARRLNHHLAALAGRLADDGLDVVVDHVMTDDETLRDLAAACGPERTFLVGVFCDQAVAAERERQRGDRSPGLARYQHGVVHAGWRPYDLTVDTTAADPEVLARKVRDLVVASAQSGLAQLRPT